MVARAKVRIEGEDATGAAFKAALGNAQKTANQMSTAFRTAFAGISIAAIAGVGRDAIKLGDDIHKAAVKAGLGGKAMSELAYAAKLADIEIEGLSTSIRKMQINLSEAGTGSKKPLEALRALGLELDDLKKLAADHQFELIGDRISRLKDPADRARASTELFGKAGADLLPLFEQGAAGIREARIEAEKLGHSFDNEMLQKLADADDATARLAAAWNGFSAVLMSKVAPALTHVLNQLAKAQTYSDLPKNLPMGALGPFGRSLLGAGAWLLDDGAGSGSGGTSGIINRPISVPGFVPDPDKGAGRDADRSNEERMKNAAEAHDRAAAAALEHQQQIAEMNQTLDEHAGRLAVSVEDHFRNVGAALEDLDIEVTDHAAVWRQTLTGAIDAWGQAGKHTTRELMKFIAIELGQLAISKAFSTSGSGGGFVGAIASGISSIFGYANGGRPPVGRLSIVGERGPELFVPDKSGTIVPNHQLTLPELFRDVKNKTDTRRPISITQHNNIHLGESERGPAHQRRIVDEAIQRNNNKLIDELERRGLLLTNK